MTNEKIQVAIIIPGGIGTGHNNIGVPVLERIIKLLAADFEITVFQLCEVNKSYKPEGFKLIDIYSSNPVIKILKFFLIFLRHQNQSKFKVVHGFWALPNGFLAVLMGKLFKIKSMVSFLGGDAIGLKEIQYGQLRSPFYRWLTGWTLKHANEVNALTHYLISNLHKVGLRRNDIKVIPWGIDTKLFPFSERLLTEPIQFLHIGNLHPVKDQNTLLRTFKIISEKVKSHLTIIGEGISEQHIKLLATELGLKDSITFQRPLPYEDLPAFYKSAHILLHTSLSEGQSEVVTEAMSSGVIVCGTKVGLIYDEPTCCIGVSVGDFQKLADEVLVLLNDPEQMRAIRNNAFAWTSFHAIHWTVESIKKLYLLSIEPNNAIH